MKSFKVTLTRDNDTTDGSAPQSHLVVTVRVADQELAEAAARDFWEAEAPTKDYLLTDVEEV